MKDIEKTKEIIRDYFKEHYHQDYLTLSEISDGTDIPKHKLRELLNDMEDIEKVKERE